MYWAVPLSTIKEFCTVHTAMVYVIQISLTACEQDQDVLILLASCQQTCMTYTIAVCIVQNSLMVDRGTARNM